MRSAKLQLSFDPQLPHPARPWANPVVPGDHPDPTIIRVGRTFWASATSGEWSPQFPLFRSSDLSRWETAGAVFPMQPAWADGSFWAPELVHDELSDRYFCWYVAHKRGGNLCIAVATAEAAQGPYTDHGPLVCEDDGSIDPCFARDEHGEPYLIWKEDGNSVGRPTPIWAQRLTEDMLHLEGERVELIRNDSPWEAGVVEGPYILRRRGWFYMFYAGNSCCGRECKYAEGVARSQKLLGPWEKCPANPIVGANDSWRCPGHGTAVRTSGQRDQPAQDYLLYHAYPAQGTIYVGREAVLDEILWSEDEPNGAPGWPVINSGKGPAQPPSAQPMIDFIDEFRHARLGPAWQWPVNTHPDVHLGRGSLTLRIPESSPLSAKPVESAMLAVPRPASNHYQATVLLTVAGPPDPRLWAGLAIVGDPFNTIGLGLRGDDLILWERRGNTQRDVWRTGFPGNRNVWLRATSIGSEHHLHFAWSTDEHVWHTAGEQYDASDLPAWDRGLRIGLMLEGPLGTAASYHSFELRAQP